MMGTKAILDWMWGALGLYWLLSAFRAEKAVTREEPWWRVLRLLILMFAFVLLLSPWLRAGLLGRRFVPGREDVKALGVGMAGAGILLCVWARICLGKYWSDQVVLKADHALIRSGPYAYLRHPIYSGVLLGMGGTALAVGEWRCIVALVLMATNYFFKARREERMLAGSFGEAYAEYKRETGFFLPGL